MSGTRKWTFLGLVVGGLCLGCRQQEVAREEPSASEREGRSEVLRGIMASKERTPDPAAMRGPSGQATPGALGQGGSGRPEPTGRLQGQVTWVGDDELLIRDPGGVERDVEVKPETRLQEKGSPVTLRRFSEGDEVRVSYDEGPGGWVAREVELLPAPESPPPPGQNPRPREDGAEPPGRMAPPR
ncbi:hypothetical protein [Myxococcus sp. RHSTA-1-4]|uniref:hypothetical protein n=1 Tax=Myxococcus sp. RHSTA-1-4 TaxID=2874601 RepID=UPI001CC19CA0|nr:hypothetical protein [Myxococcus sp. RHSTA-1-4]MBZ4421376.1 hypothetical protein [Myxococcus sp. RHSTA-1-4]